MITKEQYEEAKAQADAAGKVINDYHAQAREEFRKRWDDFTQNGVAFVDEDLVYSAITLCKKCDAGLAYPKNCHAHHQWTCSAVLKGIGTDKGHSAYSFMDTNIKSENQASANNRTTRPPKEDTT